MAVLKSINSKAPIKVGVNYITQDEKVKDDLIATKNCMPETALEQMESTKEFYEKEGGRTYKHYVVSFSPDDNLTPDEAYKIGCEYMDNMEKWNGHEVIMATHTDEEHLHNHYIVNTVNFETGYKYQESKQELEQMKDQLRELSQKYELVSPDKIHKQTQEEIKLKAYDTNKHEVIKQAEQGTRQSYVLDTYNTVQKNMDLAKSQQDFIEKMKQDGYQTNWTETRKHVTFENQENKKVRLANLEKTFNDKNMSKDGLTQQFERNQKPEFDFEKSRNDFAKTIVDRNNLLKEKEEIQRKLGQVQNEFSKVEKAKMQVNQCQNNINQLENQKSKTSIFNLAEKRQIDNKIKELEQTKDRLTDTARQGENLMPQLEQAKNNLEIALEKNNEKLEIKQEEIIEKRTEYQTQSIIEKLNGREIELSEKAPIQTESLTDKLELNKEFSRLDNPSKNDIEKIKEKLPSAEKEKLIQQLKDMKEKGIEKGLERTL